MAGAASPASARPSQTNLSLKFSTVPIDENLNRLLEQSKTKVTFGGRRVIVVQDYKNSFSLTSLARLLIFVANEKHKTDVLTPRERLIGINISNIIDNFYKETDLQIKQRNFLTRFFVFLREHFSISSKYLNYVKNEYIKKLFSTYSEQKYIEAFGNKKKASTNEYKHEIERYANDQIVVTEDAIKSLIKKV
ncbi:MAG: hypothetical protein KR126chlam6_00578 [Candidatus Anoxychlamydiales bacterium]|nr:hypothetical protein [Candidatus Anoxychlamydiales bacterium]